MGSGRLGSGGVHRGLLELPRNRFPGHDHNQRFESQRFDHSPDHIHDRVGSHGRTAEPGRRSRAPGLGVVDEQQERRTSGRRTPSGRRVVRPALSRGLPAGQGLYLGRKPGDMHLQEHPDQRYFRDRDHVRRRWMVRIFGHRGDLTTAARARSFKRL